MTIRIQTLQYLNLTDEVVHPLSREVLAAVLRKNSFSVDETADELEVATAFDPCPTSIPGQWKICDSVTRYDPDPAPDLPQMGEIVEALRELPLKDKRGRPFCDEVIAAAIRSTSYDPFEAADWLIIAADRLHGRELTSNLEVKRAAYAKLSIRFTEVYAYTFGRWPEPWHPPGPPPIPGTRKWW
jgi:hypothetical protein